MNDQVKATLMNQQQQQQQQMMNVNPNLVTMNQMNPHQQQQPQMGPMSRSYGTWVAPPPQFQNPNPGSVKPPLNSGGFNKPFGPKNNWKGKKVNRGNDNRRKDQLQKPVMVGTSVGGIGGGVNIVSGGGGGGSGVGVGIPAFNSYQPPTLNELQQQNRLKTRKFFGRKKFNKNNSMNMNMNVNMGSNMNYRYNNRKAPYAPRNTTSFIIRSKKSGGIASLVSPYPVTPAVLPTPSFSPSREVLVDMAKEEWGVDGYGSMKGLIRLRSPGHEMEANEEEEEDEGGSSDSDVEEHVEVERRLDHDLSRFEMLYDPNNVGVGGMDYHNVLENRVDDQDSHIAHLEEENLILKERLFLMERELGDLRRRMLSLEKRGNRGEEINEEVVENESDNDSESRGEEGHSVEDNNDYICEDNVQGDQYSKGQGDDSNSGEGFDAVEKNLWNVEGKVENNDNAFIQADRDGKVADVEPKEENNRDDDNAFIQADRDGKFADVEHKEENNRDDFIEANTTEKNTQLVEDIEKKFNEESKFTDVVVNAEDTCNIESFRPVGVGDVCRKRLELKKIT